MTAFPRFLLVTSLAFLLSGCMGGNFLIGKWTFDADATMESLQASEPAQPDPDNPAGNLLKGIVGGLQKGMLTLVVGQLEGTNIEFTRDEMRRVQNGVGESQGYEIIEKVSSTLYLVKYEDGEILSWGKTENGIKMQLGGDEDAWVHFRPAGK